MLAVFMSLNGLGLCIWCGASYYLNMMDIVVCDSGVPQSVASSHVSERDGMNYLRWRVSDW